MADIENTALFEAGKQDFAARQEARTFLLHTLSMLRDAVVSLETLTELPDCFPLEAIAQDLRLCDNQARDLQVQVMCTNTEALRSIGEWMGDGPCSV